MSDIVTQLQSGCILNGIYRIERVLGQGGFGITYLATDISLERLVAVKEFFPKEYCNRDSDTSHVTVGTVGNIELVDRLKKKFLKEARNIAKFHNPYIVRILTAFEANDTAYYVMDYIEGENLSDMVKRYGPLPEWKALEYIEKIGLALEYLHDKHHINHLDVKPANIMVRRSDDTPILIDFGLSKQYGETGHQTSTTPVGISHGYAPIEQYTEGGVSTFSPTTDIYSLAASLYYLLTGVKPPSAPSLQDEGINFPQNIDPAIRSAIEKAMSLSRKNRQPNVRQFLMELRQARPAGSAGVCNESTRIVTDSLGTNIAPVNNRIVHGGVIETPVPSFDTPSPSAKPWYSNIYNYIGVCAVIAAALIVWLTVKSLSSSAPVAQETVLHEESVTSQDAVVATTITEAPDATEIPSEQTTPTMDIYGGHKGVDLGLSVIWADCNLGAGSPSDYGNYYTWGETYPGFQYNYCSLSSSICGNASYDAAAANWGSGWKMPTSAQCKELLNNCSWIWTSQDGVKGYRVTGPNGNSIFLPGAGYYKDGKMEYMGSNGNYWSGSPSGSDKASYISFQTTDYRQLRTHFKDRARSIRPVRNK